MSSEQHPQPPASQSDNNGSEGHKQQGNLHFAAGRYDDAIKEYSVAIIKNPSNAIYYSNRALCYLRLSQHEKCISDCTKAVELDSRSVKGLYLMGQALLELGSSRLNEAIASLKKAYVAAIEQKVAYADEIAMAVRKARAKRWELKDRRRREEESDLYRYLTGLVDRDRKRQLEQAGEMSQEDKEQINELQDQRIAQITDLFGRAEENGKKREVPDVFIGKISFELMSDPVITPSGITYDRTEILSHLRKIGKWDPFTRKPLYEQDLIPNLGLKEEIEAFLEKNEWAADY